MDLNGSKWLNMAPNGSKSLQLVQEKALNGTEVYPGIPGGNWEISGVPRNTWRYPDRPGFTKTEMSINLKFRQNWSVTKTEMWPKWNVTRTQMSPKLICHQNWNVTETKMSPQRKYPKLKCHQNLNIAKTQMSPKLKYHLNWNIT